MTARKRLTRTVRLGRNGRLTIPADFRRAPGIADDSLLQMSIEGEELRIGTLPAPPDVAGSPWLAELYRRFAPVREEAITEGYAEEEINGAIDRAVVAVRSRRVPQG